MTAETAYRISALTRNAEVIRMTAPLHVNTTDADALQVACRQCDGIGTAPAREVLIFAAAVVRRHQENRTAYSVALRRAV